MDGCCLTCGQFDDLEAHHVAGRHNHQLIVAVCVDCHRILSRWQLAAGMELEHGAAGDLDRTGPSWSVPRTCCSCSASGTGSAAGSAPSCRSTPPAPSHGCSTAAGRRTGPAGGCPIPRFRPPKPHR